MGISLVEETRMLAKRVLKGLFKILAVILAIVPYELNDLIVFDVVTFSWSESVWNHMLKPAGTLASIPHHMAYAKGNDPTSASEF
jgi:hypothetical protein